MKSLLLAVLAAIFVALGGNAALAQTALQGSQFNGLYLAANQKEGVGLVAFSPGNVFTFGELHLGQASKVVAVLINNTGCINFLSHRTGQVGIETVCPQMDAAGNVMAMRLKSSGEEFLLQR